MSVIRCVITARPSKVISRLLNVEACRRCNSTTPSRCLSSGPDVTSDRTVSTYGAKAPPTRRSLLRRALAKVPFLNVDQIGLRAAGYFLYESIVDRLDYVALFERFDLPDTFYSWFAVTELHVWMLSARAMAEGDDGRRVRNAMLEALWSDVGPRMKKLGAVNPSGTRRQIRDLSEQLQAALVAYDEGLQSDDVVLAGALWRRMYQMDAVDPEHLEGLVRLVRRQVQSLDAVTWDELTVDRKVQWLPPAM